MNSNTTGLEYWRSLEQLADDPAVRAMIEKEFPGYDPETIRSMSRRRFMKLMGASLALAGLTLSGCRRWPKEKLAPYSSNPKHRIPGVPEQYATVMELGGVAEGLLVTSFDGRPIKVEGNPSHPFARTLDERLGAADAYAQASVLELYDPDRSRFVVERSGQAWQQSSWDAFGTVARQHFAALRGQQGAGFAVLSEAAGGPSMLDMRRRLLGAYPQCRWYEYEPISDDNETAGARMAFGQAARPRLHLEKAQVIVSFDADLLGRHPAHIRYAADWAAGRKSADQGRMNRLYMVDCGMSPTGGAADVRLPARLSRAEALVAALAQRLNVAPAGAPAGGALSEEEARFIEAVAADLGKHRGAGVIAAGAHLSPAAHAMVFAMNRAIGAVGSTLTLHPLPDGQRPSHVEAIGALAAEMKAGRVKTLLILGGNPSYDAPADLEFAAALASVPMSIHLSLYNNETSTGCRWHLPRAHYLEAWGDGRGWDGTISIAQPLIHPIYDGKSALEVLALVSGDELTEAERIVRRTFEGLLPKGEFESAFRRVLHDGLLANSAYPVLEAGVAGRSGPATQPALASAPSAVGGLEVKFVADQSVYDGRFANSGWLQELPDSLTKLTWDNAALMSKKDADALGVTTGDVVQIGVAGRSLEMPVYVMPGQPAGLVTLPLGYGRTAAGAVGNKVGFNTYVLRQSRGMQGAAAQIKAAGRKYLLATTQDHHIIDSVGAWGREARVGAKGSSGPLIRQGTLSEYQADPKFATRGGHATVSLPLFERPSDFRQPHAWGMALDMSSCIGCGACVVACQAENNVPVVGKDQVAMSREMHWLRIDRYFKGKADDPNPEVVYQPMLCQHCENAPCEQVCPVAATVHDTEGLNTMVYNRCIGTRYCSNNCPYKVRRFNYFDYHSKDPRGAAKPWLGMPDTQQRQVVDQVKRMVFNPDVTVRMRGVMEKCTFCVQRIHAATSARRRANEPLQDGDIVTACQQACPTQAIVFGDLNDPNSRVSQLHRNNRAYGLLEELETRPRAKYLARVKNPADGGATRPAEEQHG